MALSEAIDRYVNDGDTVYAAGFTHLIPFAAGHEIIRKKKKQLTLARATPDLIYDQLIAAGCASKVIFSWAGNPGVGSLRALRKAVEKKTIEVEEYSHFGMIMALTAGASRLPFMPLYTNTGSDLVHANQKLKEVLCPYTGTMVPTVPALNPDVAIIHAQRATIDGDIQVWGITGEQKEAAFASKRVIVTVEEIIDTATARKTPQYTIIPGFKLNALCVVPFGAHPSYAQDYYQRDNDFYVEWDRISADEGGLKNYLDEWVHGVKDREDYCARLSPETRAKLCGAQHAAPLSQSTSTPSV